MESPRPPSTFVLIESQGTETREECEILDVNGGEITVGLVAQGATPWKKGAALELLGSGQQPLTATVRSVHPKGTLLVMVLATPDGAQAASFQPCQPPDRGDKRCSFRVRVGYGAGIQVTVRPEDTGPPGKRRPKVTKGFPGFLLDASFDGACVLVDRAAAGALPQGSLVRTEIITGTRTFVVFGAIRHSGRVRLGARLGIEAGSFPHAHWEESEERHLREFVLEQQRNELQRRRAAQ